METPSLRTKEFLQVQHKVYNDFCVLRIKVVIMENSIKLEQSPSEYSFLHCNSFNIQIPFYPLLDRLRPLLTTHGISSIVKCYADPLPLLEVQFDDAANMRNFLLHIEDITPHLWIIIWNSFHTEAQRNSLPLLKGQDDSTATIDSFRLQHMFRSGNSCQLELLHISPNSALKEVKIVPITLANYETIVKAMATSVVFDFQSAMNTFLNDKSQPHTLKGRYTISVIILASFCCVEVVLLDDLKMDLKTFSSWFHMGIVTRLPFSTLMGLLYNFRHRGMCYNTYTCLSH